MKTTKRASIEKTSPASPQTEAIRSIFLNPRPWYPMKEFATACGLTIEAMIADLDSEDYRTFSSGAVEIHHSRLWKLFEIVGHAAIEDALGEDASSAMLPDRMTETVMIRLPKFAVQWLTRDGADVAFEAARRLTDDAEADQGNAAQWSVVDFPKVHARILPAFDTKQDLDCWRIEYPDGKVVVSYADTAEEIQLNASRVGLIMEILPEALAVRHSEVTIRPREIRSAEFRQS